MLALHGAWVLSDSGYSPSFAVWAETTERARSRPVPGGQAVLRHPNAAGHKQLKETVGALCGRASVDPVPQREVVGRLPTVAGSGGGRPVPSPVIGAATLDVGGPVALASWRIPVLSYQAERAVELLLALAATEGAPDARVGDDLRFWTAAARFALDLLARQRVLPGIERTRDATLGVWRVVLDDEQDRRRFDLLAEGMPPAGRALCWTWVPDATPPGPRLLLRRALDASVDAVARPARGGRLPAAVKNTSPAIAWWRSLFGSPLVDLPASDARAYAGQLDAWRRGGQGQPAETFRVCFRLNPPPAVPPAIPPAIPPAVPPRGTRPRSGTSPLRHGEGRGGEVPSIDGSAAWTLEYLLQALDDPSLLVPAEEVWRQRGATARFLNRRVESPQERLLAGLGRAARHVPAVEASLRQARPEACALATPDAHQFLREQALVLRAAGFGVLVPDLAGRLRLRVRLKSPSTPGQSGSNPAGFGWDTVVQYDWQVALGDERLTPEEFLQLARLKEPLVQVRGQWVELDPQQVEQALAFLERPPGEDKLALPDALRLALAPDGGEQAGLPVDGVEADGWVDDLLRELRRGPRRERLKEPPGFAGTLRPYQQVGVSWLATLDRYGIGACLADDMGLGKCQLPDTPVFVNGSIMRADQMWLRYAREETLPDVDGLGEWTVPREPLLTNALENETGTRLIVAPISRLYRQRVCERVRRVLLDDGSELLITRRHKLLGNGGWTHDIRPADTVAVPSRLEWDGPDLDADLVSLLAWQIAEGHEMATGTLAITQGDERVLERVRGCVLRFAARQQLKINRPSITRSPGKAPYLRISSAAYRDFLKPLGYPWGARSAGKRIPDAVVAAGAPTVRLFLREFFAAEGSVSREVRVVEIASASRWLMQQLSTMLRRFGIWLRVRARQKRATNGTGIRRTYYVGLIGGPSLRRFRDDVGFADSVKQAKLDTICAGPTNTNVEGVPAAHLLIEAQRRTGLPRRHFGVGTVYFTGTQELSRLSASKVVGALDRIVSGEAARAYGQQPRTRWTQRIRAAYARLDRDSLSDTRTALATLTEREVFYARVLAVEEFDYDGWVYDFEVAHHHNYVAGGALCHNTVQVIALLLHERASRTPPAPSGRDTGRTSQVPALDQALRAAAAASAPAPADAAAGDGAARPTLLVCPTSVVGNWQRELARFAPSLRVLVHHGAARVREGFGAEAARHDVVISTYALLHRDEAALRAVAWERVILDEAQNVKNAATRASQAARSLPARWRAALTGTPVENRLAELWSIFQFLNPGYLGSEREFRRRFAAPIERGNDAAAAARLKALVAPFILRRLKTDKSIIQDLPEKQEMKVYCPLTPEQATLYEAVVRDSLRQIEESDGIQRRGLILATLTRLKQVCNHPALFLHDKSDSARGRSGKLTRLVEMLEEALAVDDRALIFTQYAEMGRMLKAQLEGAFGGEALFLHGGTPAAERDRLVARFQRDERRAPRLFILSIKAGGTGLTLTRANHVFHFDRWWNPAVENQATDRAFRIGQTRNVQVHKFICAGTFEEALDQLIERKVALAESITGTSESWITELSTKELRDLFALRRADVMAA